MPRSRPEARSRREIGYGHSYELVGEPPEGLIEHHRNDAGRPCEVWVPFQGEGAWQVVSLVPLTLRPSIVCTNDGCTAHGHIRRDMWFG